MRKVLWILYQPYRFLIYYPLAILCNLVFATLAFLLGILFGPKAGSSIGGFLWGLSILLVTPGWARVKARHHIDKKQSYVIIANHQSYYDVFAIYGFLGIDIRWVMKAELRKVPGLGYGALKSGHIFIDRKDSQSSIDAINAARDCIKNGTSIIFFPEGTRSKTKEMLPFKKGAFVFAMELGLPILPITINNTRRMMPADSFRVKPGIAELIIHEPINVEAYTKENMEDLMNHAKEVIDSAKVN